MIKDDQDIKSLDVEGEKYSGREFLPRRSRGQLSWGQRVRHRLNLILLGLICLAAIATVAFGISGHRFDSDLQGMQESVSSINHTISAAFTTLKHKQAQNVKTLVKLDTMVKNLTERLKDSGHVLCCPPGWAPNLQSCYWFSKTEKTWDEAKADCEDKDAHLAIITTYQEQHFVSQRTKPRYTWIGLTFTSGSWTWVGGTTYTMRRIDWKPRQPPSYLSHLSGEPPYCAHLHRDGLWSTEHCTRQFNWVCEMEV